MGIKSEVMIRENTFTLAGPFRKANLNSPLLKFAKNYYSQSGEDGIIEELLTRLKINVGVFVEFGGWDGLKYSNCANLARVKQWKGLFIEGNTARFEALSKNYSNMPGVSLLNRWIKTRGEESIDRHVYETFGMVEIDLMSIDIDGNDFHVLRHMQIRPKVIVVEFNPSVPNDVFFVQEENPEVFQGSSLLAFYSLMKGKRYELVCCTSANAFFLRNDLVVDGNIYTFDDLDQVYQPKCNGRIFHGFDGKIYTVGMDRLIWTGRSVSHTDLQLLEPNELRFKT